ncbi:MAG: glycosyltransferase [Candidatus Omnitrophica bacterium]|nr:glycosyltransferase [Candidatus Omnitrophota bacterium]MDD5671197.1 glycosyltransferase [Candidatus Omnitrophota bacterium]
MLNQPLISIIVPTLTGKIDFLRDQIKKQSLQNWELIVKQGIRPPALARNRGAQEARGQYLLFLDDDIRFSSPDLLQGLIESLQRLGPNDSVGVRWQIPEDASAFQKKQVEQSIAVPIPESMAPFVEITWRQIGTACYAMRRSAFETLGGFDTGFVCGEDYDLQYRLHLQGGKVYALTGGVVYHYPPATWQALLRKVIWYAQGDAQIARKYPESKYRPVIRGPWHAAGYLLFRTICLVPLFFLKISYHQRRPEFCFRPLASLLSYVAAWVYCRTWLSKRQPALEPFCTVRRDETSSVKAGAIV